MGDTRRHQSTHLRSRLLLLAAWPLLLATGPPAPLPRDGFVGGVNGLPRALGSAMDDARAAGFHAVRIFLRWDRIETTAGAPDWACRYLTDTDLGPDVDHDGLPDPWRGTPCEAGACGCGYSADERVAMVAGDPHRLPIVLTILGTPQWARGAAAPAAECPAGVLGRALPLERGKESAYREFVAAAARRYGSLAYAFELWNEPDLRDCLSWAGTRQQYREQILAAAWAVKEAAVTPGLVVAPTLETPSGAAMDAWMDWPAPVDVLSFNLYTTGVPDALAKIDEMNAWCAASPRCPGFYVTEFGARDAGPLDCGGPRTDRPGAADVSVMRRCRKRRWCRGLFLYALSDQNKRPDCARGLLDRHGCRKHRLCTIARRFFHVPHLPFACVGCGP